MAWFRLPNVADSFPLQNLRLNFFEQGGFDVDNRARWGLHMALVGPHE